MKRDGQWGQNQGIAVFLEFSPRGGVFIAFLQHIQNSVHTAGARTEVPNSVCNGQVGYVVAKSILPSVRNGLGFRLSTFQVQALSHTDIQTQASLQTLTLMILTVHRHWRELSSEHSRWLGAATADR